MTQENEHGTGELARLRAENEQLRQALVEAETRKGVQLSATMDWEQEKRKADELLAPLRGGPLGRRLAMSGGIHAVLILLTSIGFIVLSLKYGTLEPRKAAEEAAKADVIEEAPAAPAESTAPAPVPENGSVADAVASAPETNAATRSRIEQALEETSPERPTESRVDLFGSDIDLDL